jgi:hypothetical protein
MNATKIDFFLNQQNFNNKLIIKLLRTIYVIFLALKIKHFSINTFSKH